MGRTALEVVALEVVEIVVRLSGEENVAPVAGHVAVERDGQVTVVAHVAEEEHSEVNASAKEKVVVDERFAVREGMCHVGGTSNDVVEPVVRIQDFALGEVDL